MANEDSAFYLMGVMLGQSVNARVKSADLASTDAGKGAEMVAAKGPGGDPSNVQDQIELVNQEFPVSAYSQNAGGMVSGPLIVNAGRKLRVTGDPADAAYNNLVMQDILAGLPNGAEIEFPSRGLIPLQGGLEIDGHGISLRGRNSGGAYDSTWLWFVDGAQDALTIKGSGFHVDGITFRGASNVTDKGSDTTQDLFNYAYPDANLDSTLMNVGGLFFRDIIAIKDEPGRNVKCINVLFSNSRRGLSYTHTGGLDVRDFEFFDCRFHSIGNSADVNSAAVYADPTSNVQNLVVSGGQADDCTFFYKGYFSRTFIDSLTANTVRQGFMFADDTGHTVGQDRRSLIVSNLTVGLSTNAGGANAMFFLGCRAPQLSDILIRGSRGHGVVLGDGAANYAHLDNVRIHNAGQGIDDTYSGFYIGNNLGGVSVTGGCAYFQDIMGAPANKAKHAVFVGNSTVDMPDGLIMHGTTTGGRFTISATGRVLGLEPYRYGYRPRETWGASAPSSGQWFTGDKVWNNAPSPSGPIGWVCTASGSPGTWKAFGTISA